MPRYDYEHDEDYLIRLEEEEIQGERERDAEEEYDDSVTSDAELEEAGQETLWGAA